MVGRAMAASTRGWTSDGPGPMSTRRGGSNEVIPSMALMRCVPPGAWPASAALDYTSAGAACPAGTAIRGRSTGTAQLACARYRLAMSRKAWMSAFCVPEK